MFDQFIRVIKYVKQNGIKYFLYKLYKKAMRRWYMNRLEIGSNRAEQIKAGSKMILNVSQDTKSAIIDDNNIKVSILFLFDSSYQETDHYIERIRNLTTYPNCEYLNCQYERMVGYARTANQRLRSVNSDFVILICRPVQILRSDWVQQLLSCVSAADAGLATSADSHGLAPACCIVSRAALRDVGEFHELYFTPYANADLCLRFQEKGKTLYISDEKLFDFEPLPASTDPDISIDAALIRDRWRIEVFS